MSFVLGLAMDLAPTSALTRMRRKIARSREAFRERHRVEGKQLDIGGRITVWDSQMAVAARLAARLRSLKLAPAGDQILVKLCALP